MKIAVNLLALLGIFGAFLLIGALPAPHGVQQIALWVLRGIAVCAGVTALGAVRDRMKCPFDVFIWKFLAVLGIILSFSALVLTGGVMGVL